MMRDLHICPKALVQYSSASSSPGGSSGGEPLAHSPVASVTGSPVASPVASEQPGSGGLRYSRRIRSSDLPPTQEPPLHQGVSGRGGVV